MRDTVSIAVTKMYEEMSSLVGSEAAAGMATGLGGAQQLVLAAVVLSLRALRSATVPLWFCIACPAVLGLLMPLVINYGLGEVRRCRGCF